MGKYTNQANDFYLQILTNKTVWTIKDKNGYPAPKNNSGDRAMSFWSSEKLVLSFLAENKEYSGFKPDSISLADFQKKWLLGLSKDGLLLGINWSGKNASGYDVKVSESVSFLESTRQ